jgi:hypothetical protein
MRRLYNLSNLASGAWSGWDVVYLYHIRYTWDASIATDQSARVRHCGHIRFLWCCNARKLCTFCRAIYKKQFLRASASCTVLQREGPSHTTLQAPLTSCSSLRCRSMSQRVLCDWIRHCSGSLKFYIIIKSDDEGGSVHFLQIYSVSGGTTCLESVCCSRHGVQNVAT